MKALKKVQSNIARSDASKFIAVNKEMFVLPSKNFNLSSPDFEKNLNMMQKFHKRLYQKGYSILYSSRYIKNTSFTEYNVYSYGNNGYLSGYFNDDSTSVDLILEQLAKHKTEAIVLSDISPFILDYYIQREGALMKPLSLVEDKQAFAKQKLCEFYRDICKYNLKYHKDDQVDFLLIYDANHNTRRRHTHVPLSIGIWGAEQEKTSVILGAPHPLLVHEDLSLTVELDELKAIWKHMTESYMEVYV